MFHGWWKFACAEVREGLLWGPTQAVDLPPLGCEVSALFAAVVSAFPKELYFAQPLACEAVT